MLQYVMQYCLSVALPPPVNAVNAMPLPPSALSVFHVSAPSPQPLVPPPFNARCLPVACRWAVGPLLSPGCGVGFALALQNE